MIENKYSDLVKLEPWVGENYEYEKHKMLILGMSCHSDDKKYDKKRVIKMIKSISNESWTYSFFTKIMNIFNNEFHWVEHEKNSYDLDNKLFWDSVAFYEYIQYVLSGPKEKVPEKYWDEAEQPFLEVITKLKPDIILAMGYETYDRLPEYGEKYKEIKIKNQTMEVWKYKISEDVKPYLCRIRHPSSFGFKNDEWIELFEKFLNRI